jgi:hypothetical protein
VGPQWRWCEEALKVSKKGFTLDNIELMDFLGEMGRAYAEQSVKLEHFDHHDS